ncbi:C-type lectin domain family 4 member M-like isoform X2 [Haliotis rubra]|uniref:C-type lectin domain family 4 member M-like isoform X2 n=1 Tax=Haliotis rubra TaxID=36100 RepID=UPI001EE594E3|nr:C-type lectin domain family 4 member M-like isoform X2 [Haliotis rubra]
MKRAKLHAVAAVYYLMMTVKLHAVEHKENGTDTCILKLKENTKRIRSEVINELKEEIKEEFKNQFKEHELLKKEIAVERARQRVIEEKVDVSYERVQKFEAALSQCAPITVANTVTSTTMTTTTTTTTTTAKPKLCDAGFVKFEEHCYLLELDKTNWSSARTRCRILGADLVSVNTEAENDFLIEKIKEYYPPDKKKSAYFWMGMMYAGGNYMWVDGTDVGFTDWRWTSEPNCMNGKCKAFITASRSVYKWEDARRNDDIHYICEKNAS